MNKPSWDELWAQNAQLLRRLNELTEQLHDIRGNPRMPPEDANYMTALEDENSKLVFQTRAAEEVLWRVFQTLISRSGEEPCDGAEDVGNKLQTLGMTEAFGPRGEIVIQNRYLERRGRDEAIARNEGAEATDAQSGGEVAADDGAE